MVLGPSGLLLCVRTPKGLHLPGGGIDPGESAEQAAVRENLEETGLPVVIGRHLGTATQYVINSAGEAIAKRCSYFTGSLLPGCTAAVGAEIDQVPEWVPLSVAASELRLGADRWAVEQFALARNTAALV